MTAKQVKKTAKKTAGKPAVKAVPSDRRRQLLHLVGIPTLVYFLLFCFFTWPWITHFNGWLFTDGGDGLQNVWNMWWVDKSVVDLHQLPWHTSYLHAPFGVTLVGQTLNPLNGFIGIFLQQFMSLTQAFNTMVTFSFVFGGLSMFWLCRYFTKSYLPSLIGGAIFTFSSYHFSHAIGHMQLVSLEFLPLYVLLWWKLLKKPSYWLAVGAVGTLLLILFCDYYYFLYSLIMSIFVAGYLWWRKELPSFRKSENWLPMAVFGAVCLILIAPLPIALLLLNKHEVLKGSHEARIFSTDLVSPFLDGGFWRFSAWTDWYYRHVKGFKAETTVYMGISVIVVFLIALWKRTKIHKDVIFWIAVCLFFGIMSLGPRPLIYGNTIEHVPLPYTIMEHVVPGMKLSGVPVRMMVMVTFGSAIIAAMVLAKITLKQRQGQLLLAVFSLVLLFEMWPSTLPFTPSAQPKYVLALKSLPSTGAVLDNAAKSEPQQLLNQTGHEQKMILGYISRIPQSTIDKETPLVVLIGQGKYDQLCSKFGMRYITTPAKRPLHTTLPAVYQDKQAIIYDLKNGPGC